jgi:hypothetical protein
MAQPTLPRQRIAILPLANYTALREGPEHLAPLLAAELGARAGVELVEPGRVEEGLQREPWLLLDRIPPDLVDRFGTDLQANALLVGALLSYGYREIDGDRVPQVSVSLRLVETPGGRVLWSAVHSRDGADGEWVFGLGRVPSVEQLAARTVHEMLATFPAASDSTPAAVARKGKST